MDKDVERVMLERARIQIKLHKCDECGKKFKKIDEYSWKPMCKHFPKDCIMSVI